MHRGVVLISRPTLRRLFILFSMVIEHTIKKIADAVVLMLIFGVISRLPSIIRCRIRL